MTILLYTASLCSRQSSDLTLVIWVPDRCIMVQCISSLCSFAIAGKTALTLLLRMQAAEAAGKAESMAFSAAQLARTAHTKAALAAAISASQAYNQVIHPACPPAGQRRTSTDKHDVGGETNLA